MYFDTKAFGARIRLQRKMLGMTQEELASLLGLEGCRHLQRMESGERACSLEILIELSNALHVSTDYLLKGREFEQNNLNQHNEARKELIIAKIKELYDRAIDTE